MDAIESRSVFSGKIGHYRGLGSSQHSRDPYRARFYIKSTALTTFIIPC